MSNLAESVVVSSRRWVFLFPVVVLTLIDEYGFYDAASRNWDKLYVILGRCISGFYTWRNQRDRKSEYWTLESGDTFLNIKGFLSQHRLCHHPKKLRGRNIHISQDYETSFGGEDVYDNLDLIS